MPPRKPAATVTRQAASFDNGKFGRKPRISTTEMESVMTKTLRRWRSCRRYRSTLRALSGLTARQLSELGIRPVEIKHLAREAARNV